MHLKALEILTKHNAVSPSFRKKQGEFINLFLRYILGSHLTIPTQKSLKQQSILDLLNLYQHAESHFVISVRYSQF